MALAVCRIIKINNWGKLGGNEEHTTRKRDTPNADPSVTNIRLIGSLEDPDLIAMVRNRIGNQKIRSNAVLAVEMNLSASPEYFRPDDPSKAGTYNRERLEGFVDASRDWLLKRYGNRVVRAELHLDESTPHIHAYLVPIDERGRLNCRGIFGGARKLSELQDSFAAAVKHLGIERGVKGSKATHTKVKEYYASVSKDSLHLNLEPLAPTPTESAATYWERAKTTLAPTLDVINHQLSHRQQLLEQEDELKKTALASERERQRLEERVKELEAQNLKWRQQADQLRDLPLEDVAYQLGLDPDTKGQGRWKGQGHIVSIAGSKFYDFAGEQRGGGGAIDLVMHIQGCEFKQAIAWLHDRFGEAGMLAAATYHALEQATQIATDEPSPKFVPPLKDESRWPLVQHYLVHTRKLPQNLVKSLHQQGLVYADSQQNAAFIMRSLGGKTTGAFLRGTTGLNNTFMGLAPGTKRNAGWFYLRSGGNETDPIQQVVLCKSPIDALSKAVLDSWPQKRTLYLAANSARSLPSQEFLKEVSSVVAAYDNDAAGNTTAKAIKKLLPNCIRLRPKAKDWNEDLQSSKQVQLQNKERDEER